MTNTATTARPVGQFPYACSACPRRNILDPEFHEVAQHDGETTCSAMVDSPLGGHVRVWDGRKLGRAHWQFGYNGYDFYVAPGGELVAVAMPGRGDAR